MNRSFYSFALVVNTIVASLLLVELLLYSMTGTMLMYIDQYSTWLLTNVFFTSVMGVTMIRYFRIKEYRAAFWTGIISYAATVVTIFVNYATMELSFGPKLVVPIQGSAVILQIVYGATVALSRSRERVWLRIAGWYGASLGLIMLCLLAVVLSGESIGYSLPVEKLQGLMLGASSIQSLMLAMNFYRELQSTPIDTQREEQHDIFYYGRSILVIAALFLAGSFVLGGLRLKAQLSSIEVAFKKVADPFDARVFVDQDGDSLKYRLLKPINFDPTKSYPIVVCLHGSSGTGNDNYRQVAAALMPEVLAHGSNREKFQAFVFVPQCTFGSSWGNHPLPAIDDIVFETMASIEKQFPIDSTRRYVTGISLGGYGTWHFIETRPEVFAAAIPICGGGDPRLAPNCANVPVWAFHGAHDERVPVSGSRDMIEAMRAAGGNPRYTEFPDAGHDIGRMVADTPELLDWLFAQKR